MYIYIFEGQGNTGMHKSNASTLLLLSFFVLKCMNEGNVPCEKDKVI